MSTLTAKIQSGEYSRFEISFDAASDGWFLHGYKDGEDAPAHEMWYMSETDAKDAAQEEFSISAVEWSGEESTSVPTLDSNGAQLQDGDTVTLIKDLDVKGAGVTLKRGTTVKNITLTNDPELIDCRTKDVKGLVLKTCFVKKI